MQIFEDSTASMDIQEVSQQKFRLNSKSDFNFPFTNSVFWIKLDFSNKNQETDQWNLIWNNPVVEELIFYEYSPEDGQVSNQQVSNLADPKVFFFVSQEPTFSFELPKGVDKTIYLRLESKRGHYGEIVLMRSSDYHSYLISDLGIDAFTNGLLIFRLLLIGIISFFVVQDRFFRAYSIVMFIRTLGFWGLANVIGPVFSNDPLIIQKIDHFFYTLSPFCVLLFALGTLQMGKVSIWIKRLGLTIAGLSLSTNMILIADYQWYWLKLGMWFSVLSGVYTLSLYGYFILRKWPIQKYYSIPLMLVMVSNMLIMLRVLTELNFNGIFLLAFLLFVAEIIVFIVCLGKVFKQIESKKINVHQRLILEAEQNKRLKELDELKTSFFTNISHELRTPLTLMYGPAHELSKKYPQEKFVTLLTNNLSKLKNLVNELLDIHKLEAKKMKPEIIKGDIAAHLRLLVLSFSSLAESKKITLKIEESEAEFEGFYDQRMLVKIINNLMSNALKFTPEDGHILVKVGYLNNPNRLNLSITNSGNGIDDEHLPHIFERFYQGKNASSEGTGIGLALVKELVNVLKGEVRVESKQKQSTTFYIELPIDRNHWGNQISSEEAIIIPSIPEIQEEVKIEEESVSEVGKEILLIVEDNDDMREYIQLLLADDYDILLARDGVEGLAIASKEVPDIIICDAMMPNMDGLEFSKIIKSQLETSHVPILMLTAKTSVNSKIASYELGIDNYLTKPFDTRELKSIIHALGVNRKKLQQIYARELVDLKPNEIRVDSKEKQFLDSLKNYLEENFSNSDLTVSDIAASLKMSDTQMRRKLKGISNYSPNEYLRKFRLQKAASLLRSNSHSVGEVAYKVGFENLSYFSKVFQKEYGIIPSEYTSKSID
ncbi:ATP-binding protein [Roseivirga ehrenbergii]|nr:ATP-binding protein [Roseivirga ehrenbergii]